MQEKLAKITSADIYIEDHGILTFTVVVDYEDFGCQGIGGYSLDTWDKKRDRRVGTAYGCDMILRLLKALGVNKLSEAKGNKVWVLGEGEGFSFKPKGIRGLSVDGIKKEDALIFEDVYKAFKDET